MTSILEDVYIDKLDDIVNKYSNTYNSTIKIKPVDGKWNAYIDSSKGIINKDPKFKIGDIVRISKYKNILQKITFKIGLNKFSWLEKLKILYRGHILLMILTEKKLLECFTKKSFEKQIKKFRIEKVIKRKGDKLCVKGKGYNNSFKRCIDKKKT